MSADELSGQDLLGHSSVRGGAIAGVSDTNPQRQADALSYGAAGAGDRTAVRRNPPELEEVDQAGGLSASGGVAGGARGHGGTSVSGAGAPVRRPGQDPPSSESSSRFDLDHPTSDIGE